MTAPTALLAESADLLASPWRFQWHPEVWLLVAFVVASWWYAIRFIGPHTPEVRAGAPIVTTSQRRLFVLAVLMLWLSSDWPIHDISEEYLYSVHMFQHMALSYFLPPLVLLATPVWLFRAIIGSQRAGRVISWLARPVIAGVIFNAEVMILHVPGVVNASTTNGPLHFTLHLTVVLAATLMWMPVVGPFRELHMSYPGKMIYLFLQSVVPTVPAAWLTFADGAVYRHYGQQPVRVWGFSVTDDQQLAGVIMKSGGGFFLWGIVIFMFFKRFGREDGDVNTYRRGGTMPTAEITGTDEFPLTYREVADAFERSEAPSETP